ncbi:MAG: D-alanine--D-alanine ligase, partial [Erysipelotrichaceae bacterium]|nr:D-alanine--D-alanine ligase [Erysipelotrichaceae bacterium]
QEQTITGTAEKVFRILNSYGCVRIDFMIDKGSGKVYCNEINTIPGSLAFYLWKEVGLSFENECEELIKNALARYSKREKKTYSFDTNILDNYAKNAQ